MRLISIIFTLALAVCQATAQDCGYKLYTVLQQQGYTFDSYTEFDKVADLIGAAFGIEHDGSAKNNLAIIEAICSRANAIPAVTTTTPVIDRYADDYDAFTVFYNVDRTTDTIVSTDTLFHTTATTATTTQVGKRSRPTRIILSSNNALIDTTRMSPAQVDFHSREAMKAGFVPVLVASHQAPIVQDRVDALEFVRTAPAPIPSYREGRHLGRTYIVDGNTGDTVALHVDYIHVPPYGGIDSISVSPITVSASPIKGNADHAICTICDFTGSLEDLWGRYMSLAPGRMIDSLGYTWSSLDAETQTTLAQCRRKLGDMVQGHHATFEERTKHIATKTSNARKGVTSVGAAKASRFWYNVRMWFKRTFRINKCTKRHQKL